MKRLPVLFIISMVIFYGTAGAVQKKEPSRNPPQKLTATYDIVEAVEKGFISVETEGAGLSELKVKIVRMAKEGMKIAIPVGTFFISKGENQNMVATERMIIDLSRSKAAAVDVAAACADADKDVPDDSSRFDVAVSPQSEDLKKLIVVMGKTKPSTVVRQVAIWIVTDNIHRAKLDSQYLRRPAFMVFGGYPAASDEDVIQAMILVEKAGINIEEREMFLEKISLLFGFASANASIRRYASDKLGINIDGAVDQLIGFMQSSEQEGNVRSRCAEVLGELKNIKALDPLIDILSGENDAVIREQAAEALGKIGDKRAIEALCTALRDDEESLRGKAAEALGRIKDVLGMDPLIAALQDEDAGVRANAAFSLGEIGDRRAIPPLLILSQKDPESYVRDAARKALIKVKRKK